VRQRGEDADLTVVDLAQAAIPLPSDPGRTLTLLGKTALVDHQCPAALREVCLRLHGDLTHDSRVIPVGHAQHVLHPLVVATGHHLGHAFHVPSPCLVETAQVALRAVLDAARGGPEQLGERGEVGLKLGLNRGHQRGNAFDILRPT